MAKAHKIILLHTENNHAWISSAHAIMGNKLTPCTIFREHSRVEKAPIAPFYQEHPTIIHNRTQLKRWDFLTRFKSVIVCLD